MQTVIDASALLKAYFPDEEGFEKAKEVLFLYSLGELNLFAPSLIDYEISNAIFVAYKRKRISFDEAKEIQQKIVNLDIERYDLNFLKTHLLDACKKFNISVYDASYLVLANKLKISLITGDRRFFNAVKVESKNVIWIGDFE